jgi:tetratricopeptide (TPR) repeat protein
VLGKDDVIALCAGGFGIAYLDGDLDGAFDAIDRAVAINSATASPWAMRAFLHVFRGEQHSALRDFQQAAELSPRDPRLFAWQTAAAYAHFFEGRYERASALANKTIREQPGYLPALRLAAASAALDDRLDQARKLMELCRSGYAVPAHAEARFREAGPGLGKSGTSSLTPLRQQHLVRARSILAAVTLRQ